MKTQRTKCFQKKKKSTVTKHKLFVFCFKKANVIELLFEYTTTLLYDFNFFHFQFFFYFSFFSTCFSSSFFDFLIWYSQQFPPLLLWHCFISSYCFHRSIMRYKWKIIKIYSLNIFINRIFWLNPFLTWNQDWNSTKDWTEANKNPRFTFYFSLFCVCLCFLCVNFHLKFIQSCVHSTSKMNKITFYMWRVCVCVICVVLAPRNTSFYILFFEFHLQ